MLVMAHAMTLCPDLWHTQNPHAACMGGRIIEQLLLEGVQYIADGVEQREECAALHRMLQAGLHVLRSC